jgi:hypothetical protein
MKLSAVLRRNYANPTCLGHLEQNDTNKYDPIRGLSWSVAKANEVGVIAAKYS